LLRSGVLDVSEMPDFDEEEGGLIGGEDDGDDGGEMEVVGLCVCVCLCLSVCVCVCVCLHAQPPTQEVNDTEPLFLKGQTRASVNLSPVKIVKNPDGSLQRAADMQVWTHQALQP